MYIYNVYLCLRDYQGDALYSMFIMLVNNARVGRLQISVLHVFWMAYTVV